jgi:gamma-glutamyl-gamma-aminobutyrate hydrolase PuuD
MKIALSMEMTRVLRDTWHAAINHEWYNFLKDHEIVPVCCHGSMIDVTEYDLVILAGGNDMYNICTWRNNHYPLRDHFEVSIIKQCLITRTPLVGICRGQHFLNHVMGGTHCLMEQPYDNVKVHLPEFEVTCHHTIRIDQLAPGFEVLQQDSAGVKELVLHKTNRQLGIGWHPERAVNAHTRSYILDLIQDL